MTTREQKITLPGDGEGIQPTISCRDRKETLKRLRVFLKFLKAADGERGRREREGEREALSRIRED